MEKTVKPTKSDIVVRTDVKEQIDVGSEGAKFMVDLYSKDGYRGRFFLKEMWSDKGAAIQEEKYQHFKRSGVNVAPEEFVFEDEEGILWMATTDLTKNGQVWIYSMDANEIRSKKYKDTVAQIPSETLLKIRNDLVKACEAACIPILENGAGKDLFRLAPKAFFIAVDPPEPEKTTFYLGDFGDMYKAKPSETNETTEENIREAAVFYTWMLGRKFEFPEKYKHLEKTMVMGNDLDSILEDW